MACGGGAGLSGGSAISFTENVATAQSEHSGPDPLVIVAADASAKARLGGLLARLQLGAEDTALVGAFQGQQRTGGYQIRIERLVRSGDTLEVHAAFEAPPPDAITIQVITSPAHVVAVKRADVSGLKRVRLLDTQGKERASATL